MSVPTEIVSTKDLEPGMYITELDRPWLETPFLFQGFTINTEAEIAELRRYCDYVHVETAASAEPPPSSKRRGPARAVARNGGRQGLLARLASLWRRKPDAAPRKPGPGEFYTDTVEARVELPRAQSVYTESSAAFGDMMERIREGGKVDTEVLDSAVTPMMESLLRNQDAMTWLALIKSTDDYTYGHSVSCAIYAIAFGRHLGLPRQDLKTLGLGGMLLDVGKTRIPKGLLSKPDKLTADERRVMRRHVRIGEEILSDDARLDRRVLQMVRHHHERYDGSGYPDGLEGPDIPVFARIAGIVDCYDALITPRVYAPAVSAFDAMRTLHQAAGREFQAEMVEQFIQTIGMFPNGALVELSSGEVGVVVEQNRARRLRPKIIRILDRDKQPLAEPGKLDLNAYPSEPGEPDAKWIDRGLEVGAFGIDPARYYL